MPCPDWHGTGPGCVQSFVHLIYKICGSSSSILCLSFLLFPARRACFKVGKFGMNENGQKHRAFRPLSPC